MKKHQWYTYTLAFLKFDDEILMINREKKPWKVSWNGVGVKRQLEETPLECIVREIKEETTIDVCASQVRDCGLLTWSDFDAIGSGLHLFVVDLQKSQWIQTPVKTSEGILDWKKIEWLMDVDNQGVADNIPYFLPEILHHHRQYHFHCTFQNKQLLRVEQYPYEEPLL